MKILIVKLLDIKYKLSNTNHEILDFIKNININHQFGGFCF